MNQWKTPKGTVLYLMDIKGKDYLPVAERLIWFREEKPNWSIVTSIVSSTNDSTLFKAEIVNEERTIIATAHKFENKQGFADHIEKAETGAIGRALAMCGYGTQFCGSEFDEKERLADSPQAKRLPIESMKDLNKDNSKELQNALKEDAKALDDLNAQLQAASNSENPDFQEPPWDEPLETSKEKPTRAFKVPDKFVNAKPPKESDKFVMPFGKTKGKQFSELLESDLVSARDWAISKNKFKEFVQAVDEYLKDNETIPF